jgi:nucleotide-binding universal stress UspA family protein
MTILCGTDFSPDSTRGIEAAAALAARLGEPLTVVHAADALLGELRSETREPVLGELRGRLRIAADATRARGVRAQEALLVGVPDAVLVEHARAAGVRLIVVSSVGRRAPARWLLGSVAERTAAASPVPVLVVRDAGPFLAWADGHVVELAQVSDLWYRHYDTGFPPTDEQRAVQEPELRAHLQALIPAGAAARGVETQIHLIEARAAGPAIAMAAERLGVDLICVGSRGRTGLSAAFAGSVAQDVIARSRGPVLVVGAAPA